MSKDEHWGLWDSFCRKTVTFILKYHSFLQFLSFYTFCKIPENNENYLF